jgi:hypothetical protein
MDFTPEDMEAVQSCFARACGCQVTNTKYGTNRRRHLQSADMARRAASARGGTLAACRRGEDRADTLTAAGGWLGWRVGLTSAGMATFWLLRKLSVGVLSAGSRELVSAVSHHHLRRLEQTVSVATQFAPRHRIQLSPDALAANRSDHKLSAMTQGRRGARQMPTGMPYFCRTSSS